MGRSPHLSISRSVNGSIEKVWNIFHHPSGAQVVFYTAGLHAFMVHSFGDMSLDKELAGSCG